MSAEQFAFVWGLLAGVIIGGLIAFRITAIAFAKIVNESKSLRDAWLKEGRK